MSEEAKKPFAAFLQEQRNGGLHGELTDALNELVGKVAEHGKKGQLVLTVMVVPNKDGLTVTVSDKVKLALPEAERGAAIYFYDEDGNLSRRNPSQLEMPLREVEKPGVKQSEAVAE